METLKVNGGKSIRGIYYFKSKDGADNGPMLMDG